MKKTAKNNDQNDQISALFGIFRQISEKNCLQDVYKSIRIDVYNLVLIFLKTYKGTPSNHIRQKKMTKNTKITKITKFS